MAAPTRKKSDRAVNDVAARQRRIQAEQDRRDQARREGEKREAKEAALCRDPVERTVHEFGRLDVLVNNAAFQEHAQSLEDITDERLDETVRTNVYGYVHMARAALPHLKRSASIINTGSVVGLGGSAPGSCCR